MTSLDKPRPQPSPLTAPYWEAAAEGRLVIQGCGRCGLRRHYPQVLCPQCHSDAVIWVAASGCGCVYSWVVAHHAFHAAFADEFPYTLVTVDLDENVRALGRWRGGRLTVGDRVQGWFEREGGRLDLMFSPVDA